MQSKSHIGAMTVTALLVIFLFSINNIDADSLWYDEAWTVYAVTAPAPTTYEPPRGVRARVTTPIKAARDDLSTTVSRVRDDVHPPLYFVLLDAWTMAAGNSVFALRYLSLLVGVVGAATVYAMGKTLFTPQVGLYALLIYGSGMLFIHYAQEARMYTLLMTLTVAVMLAYVRVLRVAIWWRGGLLALLAALGLYTHYVFALVIATCAVHVLLTRRDRLVWVVGAFVGSALLFAPYIQVVVRQFGANPSGALAAPVETTLAAVAALLLLLTGGWWWLYGVVLIAVAGAVYQRWARWRELLLIVLWLVMTPVVLLIVNAVWLPLYQVRYVLAVLPAVALLLGLGLGGLAAWRWGKWLAPLVLIGMVVAQVRHADAFLPPKPDYDRVVADAAEVRSSLEPIIADIAFRDPVHYYNEVYGLTVGIALDLSWRDHSRAEIDAVVARLGNAERVWVVLPTNVAKTWQVTALLQAQERAVNYRAGVENMIFYRFDSVGTAEGLTYRFVDGDDNVMATYRGELGSLVETAGETVCVPIELDIETATSANVAVSLTLVQGYNTVVAQWNGAANHAEGCLELPPGMASGEYSVYLTLYDADTQARYAVMETDVWWGWWVMTHTVEITNATD